MNEFERLQAEYPDDFEWLRTNKPDFYAQIRFGLSHPEIGPGLAEVVEEGLLLSEKELDEWAEAEGKTWEWEE